MFNLVQEQINRMLYCHDELDQSELGKTDIERYKVLEKSIINDWYLKDFIYIVEYIDDGKYLSCNCKKFKTTGILCCHIFKVIAKKKYGRDK